MAHISLHVHEWLHHYGSVMLILFMAIGIAALPLPVETLLLSAGALINSGDFAALPTFAAAYLGSLCGVTISYLLGRTAGRALLLKYACRLGLEEQLCQTTQGRWQHLGKWMLVIGYFIPGVRHFTGIWAGMELPRISDFTLFAYSGAFLWVAIYLWMGYLFGHYGAAFYADVLHHKSLIIGYGLLIALAVGALWKLRQRRC